ncbi:MAG TPA: DUF6159 family protein [Solirubrobacteraceae bacterium]|jgi:hypothetical protein|nr:DUF6159 family protein [Solirubrobacteraceae bacterium]
MSRIAWDIVRSDRTILTLAVMSTLVGTTAVAIVYDLSGLFSGHRHGANGRLALLSLILAYPLTFMSVFFNTAIAAAASAVLQGSRLSLRQALAVPGRRLAQVAVWSFLVSVVGVVIEQIASRLPFLGSVVVRLVGLSWSLASMFAIPILATEGCTAPSCLSRSAALVKKRWGEGISGNLTITAWTVVAILPVTFVFGIALAASRGQAGAHAGILAAMVIFIVAIGGAGAVIRQTFSVVLYRYAITGRAADGFAASDLEAPFSRGALGSRSKATHPMRMPTGTSRWLWLASALIGVAITVADELARNHFAAHRPSGRIIGGVMLWVLFTLMVRALAYGAEKAWRSDRTGRFLWVGAGATSGIATLAWELNRHHFSAHRVSARVLAGVVIWLVGTVALRAIAAGGRKVFG